MNKGPLDVAIDPAAVSDIIIFSNEMRIAISERVESIRAICQRMTEEESLNGGDGENIKALFKTIGSGYLNLEQSVKVIVDGLNEKLNKILQMTKGTTTAAAEDVTKAAAKNIGVMKKS